VPEPGLDRREWEAEWRDLEPLLIDAPAEALPEVDRLIERLLIECGYPTTEEGARDAADPKLVAEFLEARRITSLIESGETEDPTAVSAAITGYRNLYEFLLAEPGPP
jgi:hypothetical protein